MPSRESASPHPLSAIAILTKRNKKSHAALRVSNNPGVRMDNTTRCLHCGKRLIPIRGYGGRTELTCIRCYDPTAILAQADLENAAALPSSPVDLIERAP
jgi:hypothetical protein